MPISKDEKLINALLYAIEKYPEIGRVKLMKFVFFVDLFHYNQYDKTLLEDEYTRKEWGPVPDRSFCLTGSPNSAFDVDEKILTPEKKLTLFPLKRHVVMSVFTEPEIEVFDRILRLFSKMTADQVSKFTHEFDLWRHLETGDLIPLEMFKLSEYEMDQLSALFAYDDAIECYREIIPIFQNSEIKTSDC
jgi:hypothetical protein